MLWFLFFAKLHGSVVEGGWFRETDDGKQPIFREGWCLDGTIRNTFQHRLADELVRLIQFAPEKCRLIILEFVPAERLLCASRDPTIDYRSYQADPTLLFIIVAVGIEKTSMPQNVTQLLLTVPNLVSILPHLLCPDPRTRNRHSRSGKAVV